MKKIALYTKHLRKVSGIQTFELAFLQKFAKEYDITVIYDVADEGVVDKFSKYTKCEWNRCQRIEVDTCVYSSIHHGEHGIKAKTYLQVVHTDYQKWGVKFNPKGIDKHIAVSNAVAESMYRNFGIECVVIPNILPSLRLQPFLRFMTATRIARGKGLERLLLFTQRLKKQGRLFTIEIYGEGSLIDEQKYLKMFENYPEVKFMGATDNVETYMKANDYVIQLSDNEGFCYSVYEALRLGVPVVVTNWDGVRNIVKNGENGYIIDMELSDLNIDDLYDKKPLTEHIKKSYYNNHKKSEKESLSKWRKIL